MICKKELKLKVHKVHKVCKVYKVCKVKSKKLLVMIKKVEEKENNKDNIKDNFYVTSAISTANAGPHIGHTYEIVLTDIIARYKRVRKIDTFFLTGMAEHGTKILRGAKEVKIGPKAFADKNVKNLKIYIKN